MPECDEGEKVDLPCSSKGATLTFKEVWSSGLRAAHLGQQQIWKIVSCVELYALEIVDAFVILPQVK